jgi:hypothetical protein
MQTYAATAKSLGVPPLFLKLLMTHKVTNVTDGYAGSSPLGALIAEERISEALTSAAASSAALS